MPRIISAEVLIVPGQQLLYIFDLAKETGPGGKRKMCNQQTAGLYAAQRRTVVFYDIVHAGSQTADPLGAGHHLWYRDAPDPWECRIGTQPRPAIAVGQMGIGIDHQP